MSTTDDNLGAFRLKWLAELNHVKIPDDQVSPVVTESEKTSTKRERNEQALLLQLKAMDLEESGHLLEAVSFYRQAAKLDPDVEHKAHVTFHKKMMEEDQICSKSTNAIIKTCIDGSEHDINIPPLDSLEPDLQYEGTHASSLPKELWTVIFSFLITNDQDLVLLQKMTLVCRFFYHVANSSELWCGAATKIWSSKTKLSPHWNSWRDMCIKRPRLLFYGIYISTFSYVRAGEQAIDAFYQPYHLVTYYRYLRFFPNGSCVYYSSAEPPTQIVPFLKQCDRKDFFYGSYEVIDNTKVSFFKIEILLQNKLLTMRICPFYFFHFNYSG